MYTLQQNHEITMAADAHSIKELTDIQTAAMDPTFRSDRCLENMLKVEETQSQHVFAYFTAIQQEITQPMRRIVAEWMIEVCAEDGSQEEVALLAVGYMDRFLSLKSVKKTQLQILAAACLLLASKLREPSSHTLSADCLVKYTDHSIYKDDLIKWELLVLSRLGWDLSTITPLDYLDLLLVKLPIGGENKFKAKVRQHAQAFISLTAKEYQFYAYTSSAIAGASIAAALNGLKWHLRSGHGLRYLLDLLTDLTSNDQEKLFECMLYLENIFEEHSQKLRTYLNSPERFEEIQQQQEQQQQQQQQRQQQRQQQQQQEQQRNYRKRQHQYQQPKFPNLNQTCKIQANVPA